MKSVCFRRVVCAVLMPGALAAFGEALKAVSGKSVAMRIADRTFPSVFQAWNPADNLQEDRVVTEARHDLIFHGERFFGLRWDGEHAGLATKFTADSVREGLRRRKDLLQRNPNLILLLEIRYRDAHRSFLPDGHEWWLRDGNGAIVPGWAEGGYLQLDFANPAYREHVAGRAQAAVASGVVDGIMLDWWRDDDDRLALVKAVRDRVGEHALILANANDTATPRTAPFINGYFMECYRSRTAEEWKRIADTLVWAERNLRQPRINCLEIWWHESRSDEALMRAATTLTLVHSDGYCLFSDPNSLPSPDHLHNWYPFWERSLGGALAPGVRRPDGASTREFAGGTVVYNPMGNQTVTIAFDEPRVSRATGKSARSHTIAPCDGDLFLKNDDRPNSDGGREKAAGWEQLRDSALARAKKGDYKFIIDNLLAPEAVTKAAADYASPDGWQSKYIDRHLKHLPYYFGWLREPQVERRENKVLLTGMHGCFAVFLKSGDRWYLLDFGQHITSM